MEIMIIFRNWKYQFLDLNFYLEMYLVKYQAAIYQTHTSLQLL